MNKVIRCFWRKKSFSKPATGRNVYFDLFKSQNWRETENTVIHIFLFRGENQFCPF